MLLCPPISTLFPYTTLFRSGLVWFTTMHYIILGLAWCKTFLSGISLLPICADELVRQEAFSSDHVARSKTDRKSTRLNSSHTVISYAVFCLKKKKQKKNNTI